MLVWCRYITTKNNYFKREAVCSGMIEDVDGNGELTSGGDMY